jgi:tyrosine-protein phosphatase YwqE
LLPGIDDGARTFEDSLRLTQAAKFWNNTNHYYSHIIQHVWDNTLEEIQILKDTTAKLATANISIPFKAAAEY